MNIGDIVCFSDWDAEMEECWQTSTIIRIISCKKSKESIYYLNGIDERFKACSLKPARQCDGCLRYMPSQDVNLTLDWGHKYGCKECETL